MPDGQQQQFDGQNPVPGFTLFHGKDGKSYYLKGENLSDDEVSSRVATLRGNSTDSRAALSPREQALSSNLDAMTRALSSQPMATPEAQGQFDKGKQKGFGDAIATAGSMLSPAIAAGRAGLVGAAARTALAGAGAAPGVAIGQQSPTPASVAKESALYGAGQGIGEVGSAVGPKVASVASQSLARLLRLTPKSFEFGRSPATQVLDQQIPGTNLEDLAGNISDASKQTTAKINDVLKATPGSINAENAALDVANSLPGTAGNRFLQMVDDAASKLGLRSNQLTSLSATDANALKQEVARQSRFIEGDLRPSVANAGKVFGGRVKTELIRLNPDVEGLLRESSNLTEASKRGDYAVRMEQAGRAPVSGFQIDKPVTYARPLTDTVGGSKLLYILGRLLSDGITPGTASRIAVALGDSEQ